MSRAFASSLGIMAACIMAGLLGVIAVSGRWPADAPRTHVEAGGILSLAAERVSRVEFSSGEQRAIFSRNSREEWLFNDAPTEPAVAGHIATAIRLLTISAPRRVLAASEYNPDQLAEYGLDPPRFVLAVAQDGGNTIRLGFGEATPAQNAQYVRIVGRPELYLLPRDVGEEWHLARDMGERGANLLLPVSIARVWAIEIVGGGMLYRFERDPAGLWFHHVGQHVHTPGGFAHHADPTLAPLIAAELAMLDRVPVVRIVTRHPDAAALAGAGLDHPSTILLLYSRDIAGPVARIELGTAAADGLNRYARIQQSDVLVIVPDAAVQHLATLLQLAGTPS
ncbi:MAG: DUF4340 domain-containing protein [Alphaproteobacteria bacterium]|nr:DUF4340 domain-containing protein [Alphaproteobacteria bacterium]